MAITWLALLGTLFAAETVPPGTDPSIAAVPAAISSLHVFPSAVTLTSTDPDATPVATGNVVVTWNVESGNPSREWSLAINATNSALTGCPGVPLSAIRVVCQSAVIWGGNGTAVCTSPFTLSTARQTIAKGREANGSYGYQVTLRTEFIDKWRYIATGPMLCNLNLTYTAEAQ